jgi:hypothetical protein
VARYIGHLFGGTAPQVTQHMILLDDTPSMADMWKEPGRDRNSFDEARRLIVDEIAGHAAKSGQAQFLTILTATRPDEPRFKKRLTEESLRELEREIASIECSAIHRDLIDAVRGGKQLLDNAPQDLRILYIVSDFRQRDWTGPHGDALLKELHALRGRKVQIKFVDVAHPPRKESEKDPRYHENLSIVQLRPEAGVTARNRLTEFTAVVFNYSLVERKNPQLRVKVNGVDQPDRSVPIPVLRPNERTEVKFHVMLDQTGINQVSAYFLPEDTGLNIDNIRHAVIEVRERIPILLVDGDPQNSRTEGGDTFFLQLLFNPNRGVAGGYDLVLGTVSDLERPSLLQYPSVYLVNVPQLPEKAVAGLTRYLEQGGNVAFFLGDRVNAEHYNSQLYKDGKGIFPVPLADRASPELKREEKEQRLLANLNDPQLQLFVRDPAHPVFQAVWDDRIQSIFKFVNIDRYWPVQRQRWQPVPGKTEELVTLPNRGSVDDYKDQVQDLLAQLPIDNPQYEKYQKRLTYHRDSIRDLLAGRPLYRIADAIRLMLTDTGDDKESDQPNLTAFWNSSDANIAVLRNRFEQLRQTVLYGDPLVVSGQLGKGRVVAWLTTIGRTWNNWAGDFPVSATFPVVQYELQRWLTAGTGGTDLLVGMPLSISLEATRYEDKMRRIFRPESRDPAAAGKAEPAPPAAAVGDVLMGDQPGRVEAGQLIFNFSDAAKPGVYILEFKPRVAEGTDFRPEQRGFAFNVDTLAESNLVRADRTLLIDRVKAAEGDPGVRFYTLGSDQFSDLEQDQRDLSRGPWLYLLFLLLLIAEQALAVRLSYHVKSAETMTPAPGRIPAMEAQPA